MVRKCKKLKYKFKGVFAADNFPTELPNTDCFVIVNASSSDSYGSHWVLICHRGSELIFSDPLGRALQDYRVIYTRLLAHHSEVKEVLRNTPMQSIVSNMCGLYCIYIAHSIFNKKFPLLYQVNDFQLKQFAQHML